MTLDEAMKYFKSGYEMCKQLKLSYSNLTRWKKQNFIPVRQQLIINEITGANLPIDFDKEAMEKRLSKGS